MIEHIGEMPGALWRELIDGEEDPFDVGDSDIEWRGKTHHTLLRLDGRPVASVGLVVVEVQAGGEAFPVAGVGGVFVTRDHRRQGRLRPTLDAALDRAITLGPHRAMLFCASHNVPLYGSFGFREITAPVDVAQSTGERRMPPHAMWRPLHDGAEWPDGDIRLPGLPF